jgi:hypothetical protein
MSADRRLAHRTGHEANTSGGYSRFALHPVTVPRPRTGRTTGPVECGECGRSVVLTVFSEAGVRRLRARRRLLAGLAAAGALGAAVAVVAGLAALLPDRPASALAAAGLVAGFLGAPLLAYAAYAALRAARVEDGLRLARTDGTHSLRPPGATHESWTVTEGGD